MTLGTRYDGKWIAVDLDGTLARYNGWKGVEEIGAPIQPMVDRVKIWRQLGIEVRIFTARVSGVSRDGRSVEDVRELIQQWCLQHIGESLPVTNVKDYDMLELWDDRAVQVEFNTGRRISDHPTGRITP